MFSMPLPTPNLAVLAELSPSSDPMAVGAFVLIAVALAVAGTTIWKNLRPDPALHRQFVTRAEYERNVEDVQANFEVLRREGEDRVRRIHERMDKQTDQIITVIRDQAHQAHQNHSGK
jgi:hypothetical protein